MQKISENIRARLLEKLVFLYGDYKGKKALYRLDHILEGFLRKNKVQHLNDRFSEKDVILITYGDMIRDDGDPLGVLGAFIKKYLKGRINCIHILPFFKYDSDRGFSVVDFKEVDPSIGDWNDIKELKKDFNLMIDLVINHVSDKHFWFQEFKNGNKRYRDYFIWFSKDNYPSKEELKKVFRPRTAPLLTKYETYGEEKYVWTTFPLNQVDLNFKNENVLLDMITTMLYYIGKGVDIIRLDAVAFIWKELGTDCLHLKQTHVIVQILRDVLDAVAPNVSLITETNVPHKENIKYFGDGWNEAHMIYNFTLPPLVLHGIYSGNSIHLSRWESSLKINSKEATFLNFLDSHDGIGILGAKGILSDKEIEKMVRNCEENGCLLSYKKNLDGTETPYEMNTTWWCAINSDKPEVDIEDLETKVKRYLVSRSIALCLKGVPGIYLNGLFGALNDRSSVEKTGNKRNINRKNFNEDALVKEIEAENSRVHKVFYGHMDLIIKRVKEKAFHPNGDQKILFLNESVFSLIRTAPDNSYSIIALHNLSDKSQSVKLEKELYYDIISEKGYNGEIKLLPYQILWLKKKYIVEKNVNTSCHP